LTTPELQDGEFLIKQTHMSLDPAMKGWMMPDRDSYIPPVELGDVMRSSGVGEVVESKNTRFPVGARVQGMTGWAEYVVSNGVGKPKAGETILVSGAAGSVGSMVGQIAKAEGLTVIGTAGTDDKCAWLKDDNYKSATLAEELRAAAVNGLDLYFENTGGAVQHEVFDLMNAHGRIMVCGMISDYNTANPSVGPNWIPIIKKRLTIQGFTMPDHYDKVPEMMQAMAKYLMEGKIKYRAHTLDGLESAIEGINLLFTGGNTGKLMVKL